jgi:3-methyladenine DNA glycosylase/8-oxoguanine DNA glycosylase
LSLRQRGFEDVVKTICTTNVAWSATVRMVNALVDNLGEAAADGGRYGRYSGLAFWLYLTRDWVPDEPVLSA